MEAYSWRGRVKKQGRGQIPVCASARLLAPSQDLAGGPLKELLSELSGSLLMECNTEFGSVNIYWVRLRGRCWECRHEHAGSVLEPLKYAHACACVRVCWWRARGGQVKRLPGVYRLQQGNVEYLNIVQIMKALLSSSKHTNFAFYQIPKPVRLASKC